MTYPVFASGDVLNASDMNGVGLWKITSTTFAGSSYVPIESCFSADYQNYLVTITMRGSAASFARWRLRAGSTDASGNNYFRYGYTTAWNAGGLTAYNAGNETSFIPAVEYGNASGGIGTAYIWISNPFGAGTTGATTNVNNTDGANTYNLSFAHTLSASYNGFSVFPNTGTMSGTITVYGVRP
jgi:hypothetical protein